MCRSIFLLLCSSRGSVAGTRVALTRKGLPRQERGCCRMGCLVGGKRGSACPEVFQAWEYGRPWPPELPLVFLTWDDNVAYCNKSKAKCDIQSRLKFKDRKHINNSYLYSSSSIKYRRNLPDSGAFRRMNRVFEDKSRGAIAKNIHFARVVLASSDPLCETMMGGRRSFARSLWPKRRAIEH